VEEQREARRLVCVVPNNHFGTPRLPEEMKSQKVFGGGDLVRETFVPGQFPDKREDQRYVILRCGSDL
jgi:hypothetical protein